MRLLGLGCLASLMVTLVACGDDADSASGGGGTDASGGSTSGSDATGATSSGGAGPGTGGGGEASRFGSFSVSELADTSYFGGRFAAANPVYGDRCTVVDTRGACTVFSCPEAPPGSIPPGIEGGTVTFTNGALSVEAEFLPSALGGYATSYEGSFSAPGDEVSLSHAGNATLPAFTLQATAPGHVTVTSPDFSNDLVLEDGRDLDLAWTSTGGDGTVSVRLSGDASDLRLLCDFPMADGVGSVDAALFPALTNGAPDFEGVLSVTESQAAELATGEDLDVSFSVERPASSADGSDASVFVTSAP